MDRGRPTAAREFTKGPARFRRRLTVQVILGVVIGAVLGAGLGLLLEATVLPDRWIVVPVMAATGIALAVLAASYRALPDRGHGSTPQ
jgi:hypothetical protein